MNRFGIALCGAAVVYFAESALLLFRPFEISSSLLNFIYPPAATLGAYCSDNPCLYNPAEISSLYAVQALSFVLIASALALFPFGKNGPRLDQKVFSMCGLIVVGVLVDYVWGNFSFTHKWFFPNSVTYSALGVFRYALLFWAATLAVVIMSSSNSEKGLRNGRTS